MCTEVAEDVRRGRKNSVEIKPVDDYRVETAASRLERTKGDERVRAGGHAQRRVHP
jgi:hypothetical protein